jgi:hypothetical protein
MISISDLWVENPMDVNTAILLGLIDGLEAQYSGSSALFKLRLEPNAPQTTRRKLALELTRFRGHLVQDLFKSRPEPKRHNNAS